MDHSERTEQALRNADPPPFREGGGRTQRLFLSQPVRFAGHTLNFSGGLLRLAAIQAAQGAADLPRQMFREAIHFDSSKSNL